MLAAGLNSVSLLIHHLPSRNYYIFFFNPGYPSPAQPWNLWPPARRLPDSDKQTTFQRHAWIPHTMGICTVISPDSKIPCLVMPYGWPILSHSNSVPSFASGYNGERFVFEIPTLCICIYKYTEFAGLPNVP